MTWRCPDIERGVVIYDDGNIRPCCVIDWSYSKPITELSNPNRFEDLGIKNKACQVCLKKEAAGITSRRQYHIMLEKQKPSPSGSIQFLDIRNTNLCNARCQFCGPHHTNQWPGAVLRKQSFQQYLDIIANPDLIEIYFAGGEPLLSKDHAELLQLLIDRNISSTINLRYSTNLSVLKYKDIDFINAWKQFKSVTVMPSADGINETYEFIRTGLVWSTFEANLNTLKQNNVSIKILLTLCSLNIFTLNETIEYFRRNNYDFSIDVLQGPPEFKLNTVDDKLKAELEIKSCNLPSAQVEYILSHLYE